MDVKLQKTLINIAIILVKTSFVFQIKNEQQMIAET